MSPAAKMSTLVQGLLAASVPYLGHGNPCLSTHVRAIPLQDLPSPQRCNQQAMCTSLSFLGPSTFPPFFSHPAWRNFFLIAGKSSLCVFDRDILTMPTNPHPRLPLNQQSTYYQEPSSLSRAQAFEQKPGFLLSRAATKTASTSPT